MLGVAIAPNGNMASQMEHMLRALKLWAEQIQKGRLSKHDAWIAFHSTIWQTLSYPIPVITLSQEECNTIARLAVRQLLHSLNFCQNFPKDLIFGPIECLGLGIKDLYTMQEISHLETIRTHSMGPLFTGPLYRVSLENLEVGMGKEVLALSYKNTRH